MNTLHFKYALEVERTGSITQAADNLFMAQPNLSKAIKELEDTLGIPIFKRTSKGMVPTEKGAEFLVYARNILAQISEMEALYSSDNKEKQRFNIVIPRGSYISTAFTKFVSELNSEIEIDVDVKETNSIQAISDVANGDYNIGIIRYQTIHEKYFLDFLLSKELEFDPIWEFEYIAIMSKKHPLADVPELSYHDLNNYTEIVHGDLGVPYLTEKEAKKTPSPERVKKSIYVYERGSQFDLLSQVPTTYMWVSPVPEVWLQRFDLVQRKCKEAGQKYKDVLIYPKDYNFTALDRKYLDKLYESKNEVAFKKYT
jgi:DNA-binding transcriptional LysR family regulator